MILWLKDGTLRTLPFSKDKVNVITGNSKTGKTAILEIIDYCLCGSKDTVVISFEHIGENVEWYGIRFEINKKTYTIARGAISEDGELSNSYYFSQIGEIPEIPCEKMDANGVKAILESEFSIDDEITIANGARNVKKDTHLSFRYFLMFNTLSKDVVDNGKAFFDKMHILRYRDVWHQIFDLSLGVISVDTLSVGNQINELKQDISTLEQSQKRSKKQREHNDREKELIVKHAKEAGLIDEVVDFEEAFLLFRGMVENGITNFSTNYSSQQQYEQIQLKRDETALQLSKLKRFQNSYSNYKENLKNDVDSLRPITYIQQEFSNRTTGEYRQFLNNLSLEFKRVKRAIKEERPFEHDVDKKVRELTTELKKLDEVLNQTAHVAQRVIPTADKLVSFGEIKAEYNRLSPDNDDLEGLVKEINAKGQQLERLEEQYDTVNERRALIINTLNEYVQKYISIAKDAFDEYAEYQAWFDYKKSSLTLKKSMSANIANISSSSDHLFLHLCLFAGMHHLMLQNESLYVPSFLVIDQPSRPYFNTSEEYDYSESEQAISNKSDWSKVKNIFKLWDSFFEVILSQKKHFQIIMLEHVSESAWNDCKHVNLVEVFDGIDNALIPLGHHETAPNSISQNQDKDEQLEMDENQ